MTDLFSEELFTSWLITDKQLVMGNIMIKLWDKLSR